MPERMLTIDLYDDGSIKAYDVREGRNLEPTTETDVISQMKEHEIIGFVSATIVFGNPCRWVKIGNQWYWKCW